MKICDPTWDMRLTQEQLRAMYERNPALAKRNPASGLTPYDKLELAVSEMYPGPAPYDSWGKPVKPNKYRNVKVEYEGMKFDSKHELACWKNLKLREKAGEIENLERQVKFPMVVNGKKVGRFTADFVWRENHQTVVADAKSPPTRKETAYRLRKKLWEAIYSPLVIREL